MKKLLVIIYILFIFAGSANALENSSSNSKYAPPFDKYLPKINNKIKSNWQPTDVNKKYVIVTSFDIGKNGTLLDCKIINSSGIQLADEEALYAIKKSSPFPPLPKEFSENMIRITYTFDYRYKENNKNKTTQKRTFNYNPSFSMERINAIGKRLIRYNGLPPNIKFELSDEDVVNAYVDTTKTIFVFKGLLEVIDGEDDTEELAAVLSHELGHIANAHLDKHVPFLIFSAITQVAGAVVDTLFTEEALRKVNNTLIEATGNSETKISAENTVNIVNASIFNKISRKDEYEADLTGVDILANAGYNPLAMITLLYKISDENYIEFFYDHPTGAKRILNCYDYIEYNYPNEIKHGWDNPAYQEALDLINEELNSRTKKDLERIEKKQIELAKKRERRGLQKL